MNEDPNTPQLASFDQQAMEQLRPYLLDPREDYPEPYFMLEFNGVPFSTLGGLQAISGQKKNGKSFVLTMLMAAVLGRESERVPRYLAGLRVPERTVAQLGHEPSVLYVDTEMEKLNSAKVLRRVHWLCGWQMDLPCERFHVLWLRSVTDTKDDKGVVKEKAYQKRYRLIRQAIDILKPDAVFIDGIRDIIGNFNDNEESAALVSDLMALAEQRQICIWNTLHMNPRLKNDDESKMRGHLGTELGNKVSDTFVSIKKKDPITNQVTFTVKQQDARGKDVDDWKFVISDAAGNLGIPQIVDNFTTESTTKSQGISIDQDKLKEWLREAADHYNWPMSRAEFKSKVLNEIGGISNSDAQQRYLTAAFNLNYLEESTIKKKGAYMVQLTEELLSEMPF